MISKRNRCRSFLALGAVAALLGFSCLAHGETATPSGPSVLAPAVVVTPAPGASTQQPAAPAPGPETQPATIVPAARREEEEGAAAQTPAPAPVAKAPNIFEKAAAYMQGKDALALKIKNLEREKAELAAQLKTANETIATLNTELAELRAGKAKLEESVSALESERQTVEGTLAQVGFPQSKLPAAAGIENAGSTEEELLAQFKAAPTPEAKSQAAEKLRAFRAKAKA